MSVMERWTTLLARRRRAYVLQALAVVVPLIGLAGCGSSGSSTAASGTQSGKNKGQFVVLQIGGFSGPDEAYALAQNAGLKAGVAYLNSHGGINGERVVLKTVNSNGDPSQAVSGLVNYLASNPAPGFIYAGTTEAEFDPLLPLLTEKKLLAIHDLGSPEFENVKKTPYAFSVLGNPADAFSQMVTWLKGKGYKKVTLVEENFAFTNAELPALEADLKKGGVAYSLITFPETEVNVTPQMSQARAQKPDAVILLALGAPAGYALKARAQLNWSVPVVGDPGVANSDVAALVPTSELAHVYMSTQKVNVYVPPKQETVGVRTFYKYVAPWKAHMANLPLQVSSAEWDMLMAVKSAAAQAKSTSSTALANALESLSPQAQSNPLYTLFPKITWTKTDHLNVAPAGGQYPIVAVGPIVNGQFRPLSN